MIDLNAILGESEPRPLRYKDSEFSLPAELPGSALSPFLAEDLGLPAIIADIVAADSAAGDDETDAGWVKALVQKIAARPNLPVQLIAAASEALTEVLEDGREGQAAEFYALRPSVPAYIALATNLVTDYGVGLADFFFSSGSSATGGTDSKATSSGGTNSTPEGSGDVAETPAL